MLSHVELSKRFWNEVVRIAADLINLSLSTLDVHKNTIVECSYSCIKNSIQLFKFSF